MNILEYFKNDKLNINVKANSSKNEIINWDNEKKRLNVKIKAPAEDNKANIEILKFFSKLLKKKVKIISGFTSKKKILKLI